MPGVGPTKKSWLALTLGLQQIVIWVAYSPLGVAVYIVGLE